MDISGRPCKGGPSGASITIRTENYHKSAPDTKKLPPCGNRIIPSLTIGLRQSPVKKAHMRILWCASCYPRPQLQPANKIGVPQARPSVDTFQIMCYRFDSQGTGRPSNRRNKRKILDNLVFESVIKSNAKRSRTNYSFFGRFPLSFNTIPDAHPSVQMGRFPVRYRRPSR